MNKKVDLTIIRKWEPIVTSRFPSIKNRDLIEMISMYFEWKFSQSTDDAEITESKIKSCIEKTERHEIEESRYFNPVKMCLEYKLSNGDYIGEEDKSYKLSNDLISKIFEIEFLTEHYPQLTRDIKIDKITDV
jgi:hypothetical protein